jgi:anti-anti-sigma factor
MKISSRTVGTVEVLSPQEPLVDEAGEELVVALSSSLKSANPRVVIDMAEVGYVDSVALDGLVNAAEDLSERSAQLKLASVTATCREIFELTGLGGRFQFFEGVDAAVRSFL